MDEDTDPYAFYIISRDDDTGRSAHGPYTMAQAEDDVQEYETVITRAQFEALQRARAAQVMDEHPLSEPQGQLARELRSWGIALLFLGAISILLNSFLNTQWGILLIAVGLASFYFRSPAMLAVYGVTLVWAAISNVQSGMGGWIAFSLIQLFFAVRVFGRFFRFRRLQKEEIGASDDLESAGPAAIDQAAHSFPWASFLFGVVSLAGSVAIIVAAVLVSLSGAEEYATVLGFAEGMAINLAILAIAAGLASLLMSYRNKLLSITGMVFGGLVLAFEFGLRLFG